MAKKYVDQSEGWDEVAGPFMAARSNAGAELVLSWARANLPRSGCVVDIGCGSGEPIARILIDAGFDVFGIDASPTLIAAFQHRFPGAHSACEAAQDSAFFDRTFDAAVSVGLFFLLAEEDQRKLMRRVGQSLRPEGRFLFSAPREICEWRDTLTGRRSVSLGAEVYEGLLRASGLQLAGCLVDEGGNHYFDAVRKSGG